MATLTAFSDLHLGAPWTPGASWVLGELQGRATDVVVFAGDLFDRRHASDEVLASGERLLRTVTQELQLPVVLIWGNHDAAVGVPERFPIIDGVFSPTGTSVQQLEVPGVDVVFHAINVERKRDRREMIDHFPVADGPGHVGVFHSSVEGQYSKNACLPASLDDMLAKNYDAWILGHVHEELWLSDAPPVFYPGPGNMVDLSI